MGRIRIKGQTTPATPPTDYIEMFIDSADGHLKTKDDAGTVVDYTGGALGEANTASNSGSGAGVFKAKTGVDLAFKSITEGEGLDIAPGTNDITISLDITNLTAETTPASGDLVAIYDASATAHRKMTRSDFLSGISGTVSSASNVGSGGVGVFKQLTGADLEFKKINAASNKVTITDDTGNNEVDIDVNPANIPITGLSGYSANNYVDHTTVSVSGTGALTGGGSIDSSRNIDLSITAKTLLSPADASADFLLVYDTSASDYKKVVPADLGITVGETNTASNVGATGVGVYKTKSGVDLQFKKISNGSNKVTITDDVANDHVDIDIDPANISISGLSGYNANSYVDHTAVSVSAGGALTGGGTIDSTRTISLDVTAMSTLAPADAANDLVMVYDSSAAAYKKVVPNDLGITVGESNTASNVTGSTGIGVFKAKSGVDLQFKSLLPGSSKLTVSSGASDVTLDVDPSAIAITGLSGYDANKYVDHTGVSISTAANSGLAGGGTIASTKSLTVDANNLTTDATPLGSDYVITYDSSASTTKKALISTLPASPMDITSLSTATLAGGDEFAFYDISATANKKATWADVSRANVASALENVGLTAVHSSGTILITLLGADGNALSATNPARIAFRSTTATSGVYTFLNITSNLTLTVASGATLGCAAINSIPDSVSVYVVYDGSTPQLAVCRSEVVETEGLVSTTVMNSSSDDRSTIYSTSAVSNVAIRLVGQMRLYESTWGTWSANPSLVSVNHGGYYAWRSAYSAVQKTSAQTVAQNTLTIIDFDGTALSKNITVTTGATWNAQVLHAGIYWVSPRITAASSTWSGGANFAMYIYVNGSQRDIVFEDATRLYTGKKPHAGISLIRCEPGDKIDIRFLTNQSGGITTSTTSQENFIKITKLHGWDH